ncbi:MAG: cupin domain-containing protein [Gemmatimonadota bacterium]|nr:cupin domain-containing protein [Gemmatimonadota bacterium]
MRRFSLAAVLLLAVTAAARSTPESAQPSVFDQDALIATFMSAAEVAATIAGAPEGRVSDQQIRNVDAGGYNVGVGVVQRPPTTSLGAIQHHQQTEVYYVVSGAGTLVTSARLADARPLDPEGTVVRTLTGPSDFGTIEGGESRPVSSGDMLIIPEGVAHGFSEITETITYIVVRVDPERLVELKLK